MYFEILNRLSALENKLKGIINYQNNNCFQDCETENFKQDLKNIKNSYYATNSLALQVLNLQDQLINIQKELTITYQCLKMNDIDIDKYKQSLELIEILDKDNKEIGDN